MLADDHPRWKWDPPAQARAACAAGAAVVQLRAKQATDAQLLAWAREIRAETHRFGVSFVVNDRFDLALAAEADGVHLGQDDLPPSRLPPGVRERLWVGRSTHTEAQGLAARDEPIDYVAFGPVFGTRSKQSEYAARGVEALAQAVEIAGARPLVAIGAIGLEQVESVRKAGAAGFAVISAVAGDDAPDRAVRELCAAWRAAGGDA